MEKRVLSADSQATKDSTSDDQEEIHLDTNAEERDNSLHKASGCDIPLSQVNSQSNKIQLNATVLEKQEMVYMLTAKWKGRNYKGVLLEAKSDSWGPQQFVRNEQPAEKVNKFWKNKHSEDSKPKKQHPTYFQRFPHTTVNICNTVENKLRNHRGDNSVGKTLRTSVDESRCLSRSKGNLNKIVTEKLLDQKNISSDSSSDEHQTSKSEVVSNEHQTSKSEVVSDEHQIPSCSYKLRKKPYSLNVKSDSTRKKTYPVEESCPESSDSTLLRF